MGHGGLWDGGLELQQLLYGIIEQHILLSSSFSQPAECSERGGARGRGGGIFHRAGITVPPSGSACAQGVPEGVPGHEQHRAGKFQPGCGWLGVPALVMAHTESRGTGLSPCPTLPSLWAEAASHRDKPELDVPPTRGHWPSQGAWPMSPRRCCHSLSGTAAAWIFPLDTAPPPPVPREL